MIYIEELFCMEWVQNFVLPLKNIKGASNLTLLLEVVSLQLEASDDILTFKGHCKTQYTTCTKKYGFDRIDGAS